MAHQEYIPGFGKYQVSFKQGPDWSRVPGDVPSIAGADMQGFAMAIDPSRIAVVWSNTEQHVLAYHEFPR